MNWTNKFVSTLCILLITASQCFAKEPRNLNICKQDVIHYYESHQYQEDVSKVIAKALRFLKLRLEQPLHDNKRPAIVLDIDETTLSNYPDLIKADFGLSDSAFRQVILKAHANVMPGTLKLYRYAKAHNIAVFFITGRDEELRNATIQNLTHAGFMHWDGLYLRTAADRHKPAAVYKTAIRQQLNNQYDILLNIGDQKSDLLGGYADKSFKLPNPFYYVG